jgi:uncharacterized protein YggU (UPF0235/DUF167 family)
LVTVKHYVDFNPIFYPFLSPVSSPGTNPTAAAIGRLKSEPKHGKANKEMIEKLSDFFGVRENSIHIISGLTSTKKIIEIQNS